MTLLHKRRPQNATAYCPPPRGGGLVWRIVRLFLLALTVTVLWLTIENRWGANFALPTRYWDDSPWSFLCTKLGMEDSLRLFGYIETEYLGAPFVGQLNDFPRTERIIYWVGGQISRLVGLFPASNIMTILAHILAGISFYLALRLWRVSRAFAWAFSLVYSFLPHMQKSHEFISFIFSGLLPLQLYVCWYIATTPIISIKSFRFKLAVVVSILTGFLGIYWIYLFFQLYLLAVLRRLITRRPDFIRSISPISITALVIVAMSGSFIIYKFHNGSNPSAVDRSYHDIEWQSLKPISMVLPLPGERVGGPIKNILQRYYALPRYDIGWGPEASYIGVVSILGVFFLSLKTVKSQMSGGKTSLPFLAFIWILVYSSFGGLHSLISLVSNFYMLRGLSRYTAAIATIGCIYFAFIYSYLFVNRSRICGSVIVFSIALFAISEQNYRSFLASRVGMYSPETVGELVNADRDLAQRLENLLPVNSMIFMLPSIDFPEPANIPPYKYYHHVRPFLYTNALRYSYGSNKGRPQADWQHSVAALPYWEIAHTLETYGFSGILINREYYEDRGEALVQGLGRPIEFEQGIDNEWVFIRLTPAEEPVLPTLTPYAVTTQFSR